MRKREKVIFEAFNLSINNSELTDLRFSSFFNSLVNHVPEVNLLRRHLKNWLDTPRTCIQP